jgi:hypothetical protein
MPINPPTITLDFDSRTKALQLSPDPGVPVTISGTYSVSGDANAIDGEDATLVLLAAGGAAHQYTPTLNSNGTWSSTLNTPAGGSLTATVTLIVTYEVLSGNPRDPGTIVQVTKKSVTITLTASASNVRLSVSSPTEEQMLIGTDSGASLTVTGTASSVSQKFSIFSVTCQVAGSNISVSATSTAAAGAPAYSTWSALNFSFPPGHQTLVVTAKDTATPQGTAQSAVDVNVAIVADILDITPESYLQALVEFATKPANNEGSARILIGSGATARSAIVPDLDSAIAQNINELQVADLAPKANEEIHHTRACIEALRNYLTLRWKGPIQLAEEAAYRSAAYSALLSEIGTSDEEVRLARTYPAANQDRRKALADRLGIDLAAARPDILDALVLDPNALGMQPSAITEEGLERLFGLVDTTRDPLSSGPTISIIGVPPTLWALNGVQWGTNTDKEGAIFCSLQPVVPGSITTQINLYSSSAMTAATLVASGTGDAQVRLYSAQNSGLTGSMWITTAVASGTTIQLSAVPRFLSWQYQHLRTLWTAEDFPTPTPAGALPLIDPDLLAMRDFFHTATNPAYSLYLARRTQVQTWLTALQTAKSTGLDAVLTTGIATTSAALLILDAQLQSGQDITAQLAALNLSIDAFNYLVRICNLAGQTLPLLTAEWDEVFSILIQAQKQAQYAAWIAAEKTAGLTLGPDYFVAPPQLPRLFATGLDETGALLQPGSVDPHWTTSLPGRPQGSPTYATSILPGSWLPNADTSCWISPQADESVGDAPGVYMYLTSFDLTGYDPSTAQLTVQVAVDNDLVAVKLNGTTLQGLTASGFGAFLTLQINDGFVPGTNRLLFVVNNLGSANNPSGLRVEFSFSPSLSDAPLDRWRAPGSARLAWETTLLGRIDQEAALAASLQSAAIAAEEATLPMLRTALINTAAQLWPFTGLSSTGVDQNGVPIAGGGTAAPWKITATPAGAVGANAFVTQTAPSFWIANNSTALWISPSVSEAVGDAPGSYTYETDFQINGFNPATISLKANISADDAVTAIRINGQGVAVPPGITFTTSTALTISGGLVAGANKLEFVVINAAAAANPSGLRVEFVMGATLADDAWLSKRLSIDLSSSNTQLTTRLTTAIEGLQGLLFSVRDAQFQQMSPLSDLAMWQINPLNLAGGTFDDEWSWMGSYSTWRGVMTSFLFPENLLRPTLLVGSHWSPSPTPAFGILLTTLRSSPSMTREFARFLANTYLSNLRNGVATVPATINNFAYFDPADVDLTQLRANTQSWMQADAADTALFWEAFYFVPVILALQLQQAGQYDAALAWFQLVYDVDRPRTQSAPGQWSDDSRKIFYGLAIENSQSLFIRIPGSLTESSNPHDIATTRAVPYTRYALLSIIGCMMDLADTQFSRETGESVSNARALYLECLDLLNELDEMASPPAGLGANPQISALLQRAQANLVKMRSNRNIAGLLLKFQLFGAQGVEVVTDRRVSLEPTEYHYSTLMDRARQLVTVAQQIETTYLGALTNADAETYNLLKAQGDLNVANATVTLAQDQVTTATDGVTVATDQHARANDELKHYTDLINAGLGDKEKDALGNQLDQFRFGLGASIASGIGATAQDAAIGAAVGGPVGAVIGGVIGAATSIFSGLSTGSGQQAQLDTTEASYERREQEWEFQQQLASDDVATSSDQITVAKDQLAVVKQQSAIATIQQTNAQDVVNFLSSKFTNPDLYDWMSGVLGQVYRYFLQQATSIARLAEDQLAFERQQPALSVIQPDYWIPLTDLTAGGSASSDRRGLTGAERLSSDLTQLDQFAFATDRRELELTKTISLSQLDPFAFQLFRNTGVLTFSTPEKLFDQDFPGHYVRLINTVRVSVVALIPPVIGIRATLSNKGISRAIAGVPSFRQVIVQRDPESVGLSSPLNATGIFELDPQSQLLRPFENLGVDTSWRFELPKPANPFDYSSISDVLVALDYTARYSPQYRGQVLQQLDQNVSADRAFSFQQTFADAWYELNNADPTTPTLSVSFSTTSTDFPPNVENLSIAQLVLYFVRASGATFEVQVTDFQFTPQGAAAALDGGAAATLDGVISTRRTNGVGWKAKFANSTVPVVPFGQWQLTLPNTAAVQAWFSSQQITDILFVITYAGRTPAWPN